MKKYVLASLFSLLSGYAVYQGFVHLAPEIHPKEFSNLIGLAAAAMGALGYWIGKRSEKPSDGKS